MAYHHVCNSCRVLKHSCVHVVSAKRLDREDLPQVQFLILSRQTLLTLLLNSRAANGRWLIMYVNRYPVSCGIHKQ